MEPQGIELLFINSRESLDRVAGIVFIEWIVGPLHAAIEKVAGIGSLAEVGQFRVATVDREIGGRGGIVAVDQPRARAPKAKKVKNIGLRTVRRTIRDAAHRESHF